MNEYKAPDKITQGMTRDGLTELNKATGAAANISARDAPTDTGAEPIEQGGAVAGRVADRVISEHRAHRNKKTVKKFNEQIRAREHGEPSRLQFTDAERADPALSRAIEKSDKTAAKADAARAKIPKQKQLTVQRVFDEPSGKSKTRLSFRETEKPVNGKLNHSPLARPGREASLAVHGEVSRSEGDNSGVQSAHFAERWVEGAARKMQSGYRSMKTRPYRAAAKAEEKAMKADVNALYQKALRADPELANGNILQKSLYKRKIKRDYAKAFRQENIQTAQKAAATAKKTAKKATETAQKTAAFARRHWKGFAIVGAAVLLLVLLFGGLSSCGSMLTGGFNSIIGTSYTAEDSDITGVDGSYTALETALRQRVANIESEYPGYDEYRYSLDEIGHDPFELASYLTALLNNYTPSQAQAALNRVFNQQYTLTLTPVTETRYRTETRTGSTTYTDADGNTQTEYYEYTVEVPYSYYILNVSLTNRSFGSVAAANLTAEQKEMYDIYMETQGNKPYLFEGNVYVNRGEYTDYDVPPEALTDSTFAAMIQEAEKYLGYPYVWGGSSPSTSFDCSGFVSWVVNHSGWSMGRLTANGLMNQCAIIPPGEVRPGDLIFFQGTYDVGGASHVGIYVGGGMMIHCGNPISYASVTTTYWTNHFYCYGRLP
ncbi:conjugal transfer protein [Clostridia bacterium]|nr:conjugal transfer protein [Clostridia bacterium]